MFDAQGNERLLMHDPDGKYYFRLKTHLDGEVYQGKDWEAAVNESGPFLWRRSKSGKLEPVPEVEAAAE